MGVLEEQIAAQTLVAGTAGRDALSQRKLGSKAVGHETAQPSERGSHYEALDRKQNGQWNR